MKAFSILMLAGLTGAIAQPLPAATAPKLELDFSIPAGIAYEGQIETCVCTAITLATGDPCQFIDRRLEEDEEDLDGEVEGDHERRLQGGSCANCNPGPSGWYCRKMHCRRRELQERTRASPMLDAKASLMVDDVQTSCSSCLGSANILVSTELAQPEPGV
jgi:hypothetical protein